MAKLERILRQVNKTDEKEKRALDDSLRSAVSVNTDGLAKKIGIAINRLEQTSSAERSHIGNALIQEIGKLALLMADTNKELQSRVDALEGRLSKSDALSMETMKALMGGLESSVLKGIQDIPVAEVASIDIPETDLGPVIDKIEGIQFPDIPAPEKRKEKFVFKVEHFIPGDPDSGIKQVLVS